MPLGSSVTISASPYPPMGASTTPTLYPSPPGNEHVEQQLFALDQPRIVGLRQTSGAVLYRPTEHVFVPTSKGLEVKGRRPHEVVVTSGTLVILPFHEEH